MKDKYSEKTHLMSNIEGIRFLEKAISQHFVIEGNNYKVNGNIQKKHKKRNFNKEINKKK